MQQNRISKRVVEWIKRTKDKIQCCVKWSYEEVNETVKMETGVRQTCSLGSYLFTIFTDLLSDGCKFYNMYIYGWYYSLY